MRFCIHNIVAFKLSIVLQAVPPVETPRGVAPALLGYLDALLVAIGPGIETAVCDDRLQVVTIGEMVEPCDMVLVQYFLEVIPVASFVFVHIQLSLIKQ